MGKDSEIHQGCTGISADRHGAVRHGDAGGFPECLQAGHCALGIFALDHDDLIVDDIRTGAFHDQSVFFQCIHLLLGGREKDVTGIAFFNLSEQLS